MKKCPPGVICIENFTIITILICVIILMYILYVFTNKSKIEVNNNNNEKIIIKDRENNRGQGWFGGWFNWPSYPYSNLPNDVLLNPYAPPLRDERYFIPSVNYVPPGAVPINVSTSAVDSPYRQLGIITPLNGSSKDNILPLMGRILFNRRDLWNYYTTSNQHNNVKLPVSRNGKSCTNEYGCDKLYNGDTVYVEGYNAPFKVTMYDNDVIRYLPFI